MVHWKKVKTNERTLLAYFQFLSKKYKPSTLWTVHSKLKTMILHKEQIDIKKYTEVITFLKQNARGYIGKKAAIFDAEEVKNFLAEALDEKFLADKVFVFAY